MHGLPPRGRRPRATARRLTTASSSSSSFCGPHSHAVTVLHASNWFIRSSLWAPALSSAGFEKIRNPYVYKSIHKSIKFKMPRRSVERLICAMFWRVLVSSNRHIPATAFLKTSTLVGEARRESYARLTNRVE